MKEFGLGVLFVHGIGTQPPRDTLVRWGDALLKVIGRATEAGPDRTTLIVGHADAGDRSGDKPAEVVVAFRCDGQEQEEKWLLREGWWADSFPVPTFSELVSWSFRAAPWAVALHMAQRFWQTRQASLAARLWALAKAVAKLLAIMAFTPVFAVLLALTLLLGLLPIAELRSLALTMQSRLIGTVGDSLVFVESPLRAALIRGRILEGLEELKARCERTVIVAHSQGAAATLDALGGILDQDEQGEISARPERSMPDALVTFGSGVNQLASLKVLSAGRVEGKIDLSAASVIAIATPLMVALLVFLFVNIRFERTFLLELGRPLAYLGVSLAVTAALVWGLRQASRKLTTWGVLGAGAADMTFKVGSWVIFVAYVVLNLHFVGDEIPRLRGAAYTGILLLVSVLIALGISLWVVLSTSTRAAVTKPVRQPQGLSRWMDLYASNDPVPNGPTRLEGASTDVTSVKVWNRGAFLSDHTTYWQNLDGFVLRVARICAETAQSAWQSKLPPQTNWLDRRADWRVTLLRPIVWGNRILWLFVGYWLWMRYKAHVPVLYGGPTFVPRESWETAERFTLLTAVVILAAWATHALLCWRWKAWVRAEQEAALARKSASPERGLLPLSGLGIVIIAIGALSLVFFSDPKSGGSILEKDLQVWIGALVMTAIVGGLLEQFVYRMLEIVVRRRPGPS